MRRIIGNPRPRLSDSLESFMSTESRLYRSFDHAAHSPFSRLPVELHAEIFSCCLDHFPHLNANDEPPMVIARVCSAWRALVLSTPKLWASFEIELKEGLDDFPPDVIRLLSSVKVWLERSRNHPLSIRLVHVPTEPIPGRLSAQLLAILVTQARRWRHVEFVLPSTSLAAVQKIFPEDFPTLKRLKVHMRGQWNNTPGHSMNLARMMKIPWSQLTEIDLRLDHNYLLSLDEYLGLLSNATSLVTCSLNANCILSAAAVQGPSGRSTERNPLHLPALEKLHLVLQGGNPSLSNAQHHPFLSPGQSLTTFLGLVTAECKRLTRLELDWLVDSPGNIIQWEASSYSTFRSLLRALSPALRAIRLAYLPLGEEELLRCLAQLSNDLSDLDLRFSLADQERDPVTDRFLKGLSLAAAPTPAFMLQPPQPVLGGPGERRRNPNNPQSQIDVTGPMQQRLPNLERIHIQCSGERCQQTTLLELIHSRTQGSSLKQFHFHSMGPVMEDTVRCMDDWRRAGVDIKLESVVIF